MSEKKINLEEILTLYVDDIVEDVTEVGLIKVVKEGAQVPDILLAMKEACRQTLELAAENAKVEDEYDNEGNYLCSGNTVKRESILDTINQVE